MVRVAEELCHVIADNVEFELDRLIFQSFALYTYLESILLKKIPDAALRSIINGCLKVRLNSRERKK